MREGDRLGVGWVVMGFRGIIFGGDVFLCVGFVGWWGMEGKRWWL